MEYLFRASMEQVYRTPNRLLSKNPDAVVLDCGCNDGHFSLTIAEIVGTSRVVGIELNLPLAGVARRHNVDTIIADLNRMSPLKSDSIDVVTAFNVIEHLLETKRFIDEVYRILRPGGCVLIDTPNLASWHNIGALFLGLQPFSGPNIESMTESDIPLVRRMHRRAHNLSEDSNVIPSIEPERVRHIIVLAYSGLVNALRRSGFCVTDALGFGYYPLPPILAKIACRADPRHAHHMVIKAVKPNKQ